MLPFILFQAPQSNFLFSLDGYRRSLGAAHGGSSSLTVQLKVFFLVESRNVKPQYLFSPYSYLPVFHGPKYFMGVQFDQDRVLIKSVPCGIVLPGGTGWGAVFSLALLLEDLLWCSSSVPWEQRVQSSVLSLEKAGECLLQAFMENKALRVKAEGRAWSQMYSYWRNHFGNCTLRLSVLAHFLNKGIQAQLMYFCFQLICASSGLKIHFMESWSGLGGKGLKDHLIPIPPCHIQGHPPLSQIAPSHIHLGLGHLQGWGSVLV